MRGVALDGRAGDTGGGELVKSPTSLGDDGLGGRRSAYLLHHVLRHVFAAAEPVDEHVIAVL
jgi:hypothetical protein